MKQTLKLVEILHSALTDLANKEEEVEQLHKKCQELEAFTEVMKADNYKLEEDLKASKNNLKLAMSNVNSQRSAIKKLENDLDVLREEFKSLEKENRKLKIPIGKRPVTKKKATDEN